MKEVKMGLNSVEIILDIPILNQTTTQVRQ